MNQKFFAVLACLLLAGFNAFTARADEVCEVCDRKVLVSGQISHGRSRENLVITGAARRTEEAFREEIFGTNFNVSVVNLPAAKYTAIIGLVEIVHTNIGGRVFDITCGDQVIAANLDIYNRAGGAGKVLYLTAHIEHPGDALRGPLTFSFSGRIGAAKLNTFELRDEAKQSLVSLRAADLAGAEDAASSTPPVVSGPEIWRDVFQPVAARVNDLVRRLSLAEKVQQMRNETPSIPRLGISAYSFWNECLHGVARAGTATVFPQAIGMAATWDISLVRQEAEVIATEARAKHNDYIAAHNGDSARYCGLTFWTPNINIFRDPRWGRGQETYGEDPFLTARLGVAFIQGLQGDDPNYVKAMACAKHFAVHSGPEPERHTFDVNPSERDLYETYLPQFEAAVREGKVGAVMGAYNAVYGEPACSSPLLLTDILRKEWGFTGHVVSDCGAIYDVFENHKKVGSSEAASARAVKAGDDLCCGVDFNSLTRAVRAGLITEPEINTAIGRLLEARFRLGMFDPPENVPYARIPVSGNDTLEHAKLALRVAAESMVLLKNDRLLPLDAAKLKRIAVIGANANSVPVLLGNYSGTPSHPVTILDGIRQAAGAGIQVVYALGCPLTLPADTNSTPYSVDFSAALAAAKAADVIVYVGGISPQLEGEEMKVNVDGFRGGDRTRIELPEVQTRLLRALHVTGKPVVFVNCSGSAIAMPWAAEHLPAILQAWYPGGQGGRAVADVLFGKSNPAGCLPVTFYRSTGDLPAFDDYSMSNRTYRYFSGAPLFAFGHGLSYTQFNYRQAGLDQPAYHPAGMAKVSFSLKNSGKLAGDAVAQIYFRHKNSAIPQPNLALCGFARLQLAAGQTANVTVDIPMERLRCWDRKAKKYAVESGDYELLIGAASDDIRLRLPFKVL